MLSKQVGVYLLASVFGFAINVANVTAQPQDDNCKIQDEIADVRGKCEENANLNGIDNDITNSTTADNKNSSAKSDGGDGNDTSSGDHDNGHGNDPDHDDSSNPGKGGGGHGTDSNGNGNGPGK
jgi:hypothetical protein